MARSINPPDYLTGELRRFARGFLIQAKVLEAAAEGGRRKRGYCSEKWAVGSL